MKKRSYLQILVFLSIAVVCMYSIDVLTSKYIIIDINEDGYQELVDMNTENNESLVNIEMNDLLVFLENDKTDEHEYSTSFLCVDFSLTLLHNASLQNISSGIALLDYHTAWGHCIVCFNTTDEGIVFIEPQSDTDVTEEIKILNYYLGIIYGINTVWN